MFQFVGRLDVQLVFFSETKCQSTDGMLITTYTSKLLLLSYLSV